MALVTFDLFSALIDSRTGGSAVFGRLAAERGWEVDGERLYDEWDRRNKASQRDEPEWIPFAEHCRRALAVAYAELHVSEDVDQAAADAALLNASVGEWPLWPDVAEQLPELATRHRVGVLSNVDDAIFARTRVAPLVDDALVLTSERLHAYKPAPALYHRARERAGGDLVHVATSARDVRGALEAGLRVVRLRRPGHQLDPTGPAPRAEAEDVRGVERLLAEA
ncbi:haloacid dehalogenase [Geodermatophilus sp. YIM 151500]|uniref:HAD family hydrolase n=1 Tax=Geodermatophilus sp. YIM 151500 TaxID=2984531 RepID=UPI0021E39F61|nr:HAD family hydrolase [Geodermatophilus sp. YIM 151500]MCV2490535.1 haloacid dehalogenase [Geodermatophilus sp. YIM 151500]